MSDPAWLARRPGRPPVILQLGPRDFSLLAWVRDESDAPVHRIVNQGIEAAKIAATLARKLMQEEK